MDKQPFNVTILDPTEYIPRKGALPVTVQSMFEPSTERFHPDGLYSEAIFGQIGSRDRLIRRGYIDLRANIITPHIYNQLMTLKGYYKKIISGKATAYFDKKLCDFVLTDADNPEGDTGYQFFVSHLQEIKFTESDSYRRHDKIELINKYKDRLLMNKLIVIPAGVRDVKYKNGRASPEEINKYYLAVMSLASALPTEGNDAPVYDGIRYQLQMKVQEIYAYIYELLDGKGGFAAGKYTHRGITYSNRNVITAPAMSRVSSPDDGKALSIDEVLVPLFQGMKAAQPLVVYKLKSLFFNQIFSNQTTNIPVIEEKDGIYNLVYREIENEEINRFTTSEGLDGLINAFRNVEIQKEPVTIMIADPTGKLSDKERRRYLYLVYDNEDEIIPIRNVEDFTTALSNPANYSLDKVRNRDVLTQNFQPNEVIVIGGAAMTAFGCKEADNGLDILVTNDFFDKIKNDSNWTREARDDKSNELLWKHTSLPIYIYNSMPYKDATYGDYLSDIEKDSVEVGGYKFASPKTIRDAYQSHHRVRDTYKLEYLKHIIPDLSKVRPMTWVELFYLATYDAVRKLHATATRHPMLLIENIQMYKIHLVSTQPARTVKLRNPALLFADELPEENILPEYPCLDHVVKTSMSVHPATLGKYDGDHDGDVLGLNILMSEEANAEVKEYLQSGISMVDANGRLVYGLADGRMCKYSLYASSHYPIN